MKKIVGFIGLFLKFFVAFAQTESSDSSVMVLLFDNSKKVKVYSSKDSHRFGYISNDTAKDDYYTIRIIGVECNRYKIYATSIQNPDVNGWINGENIGIYTRPIDSKIVLYNKPNFSSSKVEFEANDGQMVRVTSISGTWLKVIFDYNGSKHEYWLPYRYQCPNPYSTCN